MISAYKTAKKRPVDNYLQRIKVWNDFDGDDIFMKDYTELKSFPLLEHDVLTGA